MEDYNQDRIDAYLRNELSLEEQKKIENDMLNNPALKQELQLQEMIFQHIELEEDRQIEQQVRAIHQAEKARRQPAKRIQMWRYWAAAASFLLLISIGWWLFQNPNATPNELFAANYTTYELHFGDRSDGNLLTEAGGQYLSKNYEQAIPLFEKLLEKNPQQSKAIFALGIAHLELKNWETAPSFFEQLIAAEDALYADNARWYLALTLIKLNELDAAKVQLARLKANPDAHFQQKAVELLDDLK